MEANSNAFHAVAHHADDGHGKGDGLGGVKGTALPAYGPNGTKIDTSRPFRVLSEFSAAPLHYIRTRLEQDGRSVTLDGAGASYLRDLEDVVHSGLTPVLSYWSSTGGGLDWLDAPPCTPYNASALPVSPSCGATTISDITISPGYPAPPPPSPPSPPPSPAPPLAYIAEHHSAWGAAELEVPCIAVGGERLHRWKHLHAVRDRFPRKCMDLNSVCSRYCSDVRRCAQSAPVPISAGHV